MMTVGAIQGELQAQIMASLRRLDAGTVEDERQALPPRYQCGYRTVQTVLNRLADRGSSSERAKATPSSITLGHGGGVSLPVDHLDTCGASSARRTLIGNFDGAELEELQRLAKEAQPRKPRRAR